MRNLDRIKFPDTERCDWCEEMFRPVDMSDTSDGGRICDGCCETHGRKCGMCGIVVIDGKCECKEKSDE